MERQPKKTKASKTKRIAKEATSQLKMSKKALAQFCRKKLARPSEGKQVKYRDRAITAQIMGEFVGSIKQADLYCAICYQTFKNPYTLDCSHIFCLSCLQKLFQCQKNSKSCPFCRSPTEQFRAARTVNKLVQSKNKLVQSKNKLVQSKNKLVQSKLLQLEQPPSKPQGLLAKLRLSWIDSAGQGGLRRVNQILGSFITQLTTQLKSFWSVRELDQAVQPSTIAPLTDLDRSRPSLAQLPRTANPPKPPSTRQPLSQEEWIQAHPNFDFFASSPRRGG